MTEQKRLHVAAIMDNDSASDAEIDILINDTEMRSIWSRFHLVRDLIQGEVPEFIDPKMDTRILAAIQAEPTLLVPSARRQVSSWRASIRTFAEQATGFAIAASVTAIMVFAVQTLNTPLTPNTENSAITSLQLLNVDSSLITEQTEYTYNQELLLDVTRQGSLYGLQDMTPFVSVVNYSFPVQLKPTSDNMYFNLDKKQHAAKETKRNTSTK